jgi:Holliday junction resolvase RusA-like endonuclease
VKLVVFGVPLPQGSKSAFVVKGRAVVTDGKKGPALREWRAAIGACARLWLSQNGMPAPLDCPVALKATFYMPRPKSTPKRVTRPATRPDLDKLTRSIGDALTKIAYTEDSRIVEIHVRKEYAVASPPRVEIEVSEAA